MTEKSLLQILNFLLAVVAVGVTFSAAVTHLRNRHSKSYLTAVGYLLAAGFLVRSIVNRNGCLDAMDSIMLIVLGTGELARFYNLERRLYLKLRRFRKHSGELWYFMDFAELPDRKVEDWYGGTLRKIKSNDNICIVHVVYDVLETYIFEPMDYDATISMLVGELHIHSGGEAWDLNTADELTIRQNVPYTMVVKQRTEIKLILIQKP